MGGRGVRQFLNMLDVISGRCYNMVDIFSGLTPPPGNIGLCLMMSENRFTTLSSTRLKRLGIEVLSTIGTFIADCLVSCCVLAPLRFGQNFAINALVSLGCKVR